MKFWPCTTGEVSKWKVSVAFMLLNATVFAGIVFTVKSLDWTVVGSTGAPMWTTKSVNWVKTVLPQGGWVPTTVQGGKLGVGDGVGLGGTVVVAVAVAVAVAVGVALTVGVAVAVAVGVAVEVGVAVGVGVGVGVPPMGMRNA
jgi:hypothetical protein